MKKFLFAMVAAAGMAACNSEDKKVKETPVIAPVQEQQPAADSANLTSIQWLDSTYLDLGKVNDGKKVEVAFRFKNTGNKPLVISHVSAGCGCTVPEKPEKPYLPGEEGVIKAVFDSQGRKGENNKSVYVVANTNPANFELKFRVDVTD